MPEDISQFEQSIYDTVHFFDIYDMPVTATQIWLYLIRAKSNYQHTPSLREVQDALKNSPYLLEKTEQQFGYVTKKGRLPLVRQRLRRHAIAQDKWKIVKRCAPFLAMIPFVKGLGGSGSLAVDNTKFSSDLDILVIVEAGRIWTTRLALLIISQVLGRRRKYDSKNAPDMLCLNHYLSTNHLGVSRDIQNICMAMQYAMLVPVFDDEKMRTFLQLMFFVNQRRLAPRKARLVRYRFETATQKWYRTATCTTGRPSHYLVVDEQYVTSIL